MSGPNQTQTAQLAGEKSQTHDVQTPTSKHNSRQSHENQTPPKARATGCRTRPTCSP